MTESLQGFATRDFRRTLVAADLPAGARRVYCVVIEPGRYAGGHWHRVKQEWLYLVTGEAKTTLLDASGKDAAAQVVWLCKSGQGILIPTHTWHEVIATERGATIMVIADQDYDAADDLEL